MSIEVKQLIIKSTVIAQRAELKPNNADSINMIKLKETVMEECRELIVDKLSELQER